MSHGVIAAGTLLRLALAWWLHGGLDGRLVPVLAVSLAGLALVATARLLHDETAATRAAWLWLLLPGFTDAVLEGEGAAGLLAATAWMTWAVARAVERPLVSNWILVGVASGVTIAMSWVGVPLVAGIAFAAWRVPTMRRMLRRSPGPWLALAVATVLAIALGTRLALRTPGNLPSGRLLELGTMLVLLVTPLLALLVAQALYLVLRHGARPARGVLASVAVLGGAGAGVLALRHPISPTAALLAFVPGLVVLATSTLPERSRWWRPALALAVLGAVVHLLLAIRAA